MKLVYDGFVKVYEFNEKVNGKEDKYVKIDFMGAVAGIVVNEKNELAIVRQYRPTLGCYSYEVPAGVLDKDISIKDTLIEELHEECNIKDEDIVYISEEPVVTYNMATGVTDALIYIYFVKVKNSVDKFIKNDEVEEIDFMPLEEIEELINSGIIKDSNTLIGIYKYKDMLERGMV